MEKTIRRAANVVVAAILILLFVVPGNYLNDVCGQIVQIGDGVRQTIQNNGDPEEALVQMEQVYVRNAPKLRMFLDHASVDALGVAIVACTPLTDHEAILSALNEVEAAVEHLKNIEALSTDSIF